MKRANGTGSIVRLSGRRRRPWAVRISCRGEDGRTVQRLISYHARASDAQDALEDYNRRTPRGIGPVSDMTVEQGFNGSGIPEAEQGLHRQPQRRVAQAGQPVRRAQNAQRDAGRVAVHSGRG